MDKTRMLIDATHPEETRVVVVRNGRVEEFDYESAARKPIRGNIYLAKVTRVEPSLQAAFVEYGGNRHGFLAFNEIHPDYYQIPVADRELLKREEAEAEAQAEAEAEYRARRREARQRRELPAVEEHPAAEVLEADRADGEVGEAIPLEHAGADERSSGDLERGTAGGDAPREDREPVSASFETAADEPDALRPDVDRSLDEESGNQTPDQQTETDVEPIEQVAEGADALEELPERPRRRLRQYKIQEVIKRRQIILVQVVKEERGNKGAALTTYISLAGRYTVLMPNTGRGGGISRKITQPQDRKRLKAIAEELDVAEGMGLIIRTAGASRTKQEIKRDYEYLLRLWESVRDLTLNSTAPCLVYEEGNLIKRSIRDLYTKDISGILVAGEAAYREAREFMSMLMPDQEDYVVRYEGHEPLFTRYGVERQLNAMFNPRVTLRSGGYIVINQTEALVAIDVNSGKATREFSIEETALNTNLEAAEEIARQLKLRDLAGLIVIDFIDMEEKRNNRMVERRLKDALRFDRARIQVGRISHFGLLEMSRQRLRTGVVEGSSSQCPHCEGTGIVRSTESVALAVLRALDDQLNRQPASIVATTSTTVALYILNHKRAFISEMERRYGVSITVEGSERMQGANFTVERRAAPAAEAVRAPARAAVSMDWGFEGASVEEDYEDLPAPPRREREERVDDRLADEDMPYGRDDGREEGPLGGEERRGRRRRRRRGRRERHVDDRLTARDDRLGGRGITGNGERAADHDRADYDREGGRDDHSLSDRDSLEPEYYGPPRERLRDDEGPDAEPDSRRYPDAVDELPEADRNVVAYRAGEDDRPRRGRRRGRRGGRSRMRPAEMEAESPRAREWETDRGEETYAAREEARPETTDLHVNGSDRDAGHSQRIDIVETSSGEAAPSPHSEEALRRQSIVETVSVDEPTRKEPPAEPPRVVETVVPSPAAEPAASPETIAQQQAEEASRSTRKGWWQRRFGGG